MRATTAFVDGSIRSTRSPSELLLPSTRTQSDPSLNSASYTSPSSLIVAVMRAIGRGAGGGFFLHTRTLRTLPWTFFLTILQRASLPPGRSTRAAAAPAPSRQTRTPNAMSRFTPRPTPGADLVTIVTRAQARSRRLSQSNEAVLRGPSRQLVTRRELQLAEHARDVALDRLRRDVESRGDLLVHVAARDQLEHLALPRCQLVQLLVAGHLLASAEGIQHETRQPWGEDRVALRDPLDRGRELVGRDRLRDIAAGTRADD